MRSTPGPFAKNAIRVAMIIMETFFQESWSRRSETAPKRKRVKLKMRRISGLIIALIKENIGWKEIIAERRRDTFSEKPIFRAVKYAKRTMRAPRMTEKMRMLKKRVKMLVCDKL